MIKNSRDILPAFTPYQLSQQTGVYILEEVLLLEVAGGRTRFVVSKYRIKTDFGFFNYQKNPGIDCSRNNNCCFVASIMVKIILLATVCIELKQRDGLAIPLSNLCLK